MRRQRFIQWALLLTLGLWGTCSHAQQNGDVAGGLTPYQAFHGGDLDSVNMTNGNVVFHFPLVSYPQRGSALRLSFSVITNGKSYQVKQLCPPLDSCTYYWGRTDNAIGPQAVDDQYLSLKGKNIQLPSGPRTVYAAVSSDGSLHVMGLTASGLESLDATGIHSDGSYQVSPTYVIGSTGVRHFFPISGVLREDTNGNQILGSVTGAASYTDTLGRVIPVLPKYSSSSNTDTSGCTGPLPIALAVAWSVPGPSGGTLQFKFCYADVAISIPTSSDGSIAGVTQTSRLLQSIVLPNNTAWTFEYSDRDPSDPSTVNYGSLTKVTLPTGGSISYTYQTLEACAGWPFYSRWVISRSINANDGAGAHTWTYTWGTFSPSGVATNILTDPLGNASVHTATDLGWCTPYETQVQYFQGSSSTGTLLKTAQTDFTSSTNPNASYIGPAITNVVSIRVTTTWPQGKVSKVETDYDAGFTATGAGGSGITATYGNVVARREYDYGSGAPDALLRQTSTAYLAFSNSSYLSNNLLALPSSVTVKDGAGAQRAVTTYGYDESALVSSGITTQHDANPPAGAYRGNQTSVSRWLNTTSGYLVSTATFYDTGVVYQATDPGNHTTTFAYSSTFAGAYPTQVTNALSQTTTNAYDFNTGLLTSTTDPNNQPTSFSYDSMWRLSQVNYPDGGQAAITRQETSFPFSATLTRKINATQNVVTKNVFDGLGRVTQTQLTSDPQGTVYTDTTYDAVGRKASVSNPYRLTTEPTYGITSYQYDGLGRTTKVIPPDGTSTSNYVLTEYCDNVTKVTDQAGKWRRSTADGLGRLVEVDEPNSSTASVNVCPGTGEPIAVTSYTYDTLNSLTQVLQSGSRQRTFVYDSLSRLTSSTNPEAGAVAYTYDNDGNPLTKADARNITITSTYDQLHRIKSKTYSDTTPAVNYGYDGVAPTGCSPTLTGANGIGRRTAMCDAAGWEAWSYDPMGRPLTDRRTTNAVTKDTIYTYDLGGSVATLTYPSGRVLTYAYDSAARPLSAVDQANTINYALSASYAPHGALSALTNGNTILSTFYYNNRLQPCRISVTAGTTTPANCADTAQIGNVLDFTYGFNSGTANNGNAVSLANNRNIARSQTFTYDELNRIKSAQTQATSGQYCWGLNFGYDIWANLTSASVSQCSAPTLSLSLDANNRITNSGFTYDGAGNLTADGSFSYTWNAESQIKTAAGVTYTYDGDGNRVQKSNGKLYWFGMGSEVLDETDLSGNMTNEYVYFGGKRIARRDSSGSVYYYAEDFLGSSRVIATATGTVCYDADFYPYGGELAYTNTCPQNFKFQGKERDSETGNDDFGARYYSSSFGRWLSPDWSVMPGPVPYADLTNPQTLNLYAFVRNNPESLVDADGHLLQTSEDRQATQESKSCEADEAHCQDTSQQPAQAQNIAWSSLSAGQQALVPGGEKAWNELPGRAGMDGAQANYAAITHALEGTKLSNGATGLSEVKSVTEIGPTGIGVTWNSGAAKAFKDSGFVPRWGLHEGESGMIGMPTANGIKGSFWQARGIHVLFNDADKGTSGHVHIDYRSGIAHYRAGNDDVRANYATYKQWFGSLPGYNP